MTANETTLEEADRTSTDSQASTLCPSAMASTAVEFAKQAEKLSHQRSADEDVAEDVAVEAKFITPYDPVIVTDEGHRLPGVPVEEAHKLNLLKDSLQDDHFSIRNGEKEKNEGEANGGSSPSDSKASNGSWIQKTAEGSLRRAMPPSHTNPLFPPLPLYGPPSIMRDFQCYIFQVSSFFLSLSFLAVIVLGSLFTSIPGFIRNLWLRVTFRNPDKYRLFYKEEIRREEARKLAERHWKRRPSQGRIPIDKEDLQTNGQYIPTEGGPDPIKCDVGYYARRVGLDVEELEVQTEDGFIIQLWHVYDPAEYDELEPTQLLDRGPDLFTGERRRRLKNPNGPRKFPVLLIHGLLQSAGAYCVNDEQSLAFYLCKSGYDVWLGNNRCGFKPKHVLLEYTDPRMWCWNIRQMGVFDLPALTSRVLFETGFPKIGLVAHSQGTTETFVALAKEQRPDLGEKLTVFCALAPAVYAGPLIGKMYFKFMRVITPAMFRLMFGIHAFIPIMMTMHKILPPRLYGWLGYKVFSFLFNWTDSRWDRGLRDRMFQFAPVYVSAESMRWWLGRECFAKHKCILATKEASLAEDREDNDAENNPKVRDEKVKERATETGDPNPGPASTIKHHHHKPKGSTAWYNEQAPPFAMWVAGNDNLVDGNKLLRRFERGREPHVDVVHAKVIPDYEHLDVIWAMDAEEQVFSEVREVLWKTCTSRDVCRVPRGCEDVPLWERVEKNKEGGEPEGEGAGSASSSSEDVPT